ncbi:uncharacterized protein PHACADRAFT_265011 [Phanerochaete carnosa HHB-10118-sp]|uniref:Uncharacterized protein n=1 Tax=Phanerochaete carnosa (strain HHB-10118-sp) TaxID=650164 RepID=K5WH11_PHACS|nr:uncharacterized protein PHACADRAFT_265011 [Phanerochaete carnosa HHB-10118-sp]EKM49497.1 hypothetical protein PHACADRAFT_265011 [Phanerochaete carnosa HHB-10118-sp]
MSSDASAEIVSELYSVFFGNCVGNAMGALSLYEFIINFDMEVITAWQRKKTVTSVLLISIRWIMLANGVLLFAPATSYRGCVAAAVLVDALSIIGFAQNALFAALRVYALADRNSALSALVLVLSMMPAGTNLYTMAHYVYYHDSGSCALNVVGIPDSLHTKLVLLTRCSLVAADAIALAVTWRKTFQQWRSARRVNIHLPVTTCLLRDGKVLFAAALILLAINIANVTSILPSVTLPFTGLVEFLPPILVSRFLLNLRSSTESGITDPSIPRLSELSVHFATSNVSNVIGNIGAPLDYTQAEELIRAEYEFPGDESDASLSDTASATIGA